VAADGADADAVARSYWPGGETFRRLLAGPELSLVVGGCGALAGLAFFLIVEPVRVRST